MQAKRISKRQCVRSSLKKACSSLSASWRSQKTWFTSFFGSFQMMITSRSNSNNIWTLIRSPSPSSRHKSSQLSLCCPTFQNGSPSSLLCTNTLCKRLSRTQDSLTFNSSFPSTCTQLNSKKLFSSSNLYRWQRKRRRHSWLGSTSFSRTTTQQPTCKVCARSSSKQRHNRI